MAIQDPRIDPYLILYREVQSDDRLKQDIINEEENIENIDDLLGDVRNSVEGFHMLDQLDVRNFFRDWISTLLTNSDDIAGGLPDEINQIFDYVAEDFSDSMLSRAREKGKYVVIIYSRDDLIICHSFTGEMALTTDMDVIEELLSKSNIDKFAEFSYNLDDEIEVHHYDRHDTQSFTDWLGIPEDEIAFDVKGDVRVYTEIADIHTVFEFDEDDITQKLLGSDEYDLRHGMLVTPDEPDRKVDRIKWGYDWYTDVEEFKQDLVTVTHNLQRAFQMYDDHISDSLDSFFDVIDFEDRIEKHKKDSEETIRKPQVDFELFFVNSFVRMDVGWRKDLANKVFAEIDPIPMCHAGAEFSEDDFVIGNFRVYNELDLNSAQIQYIDDLLLTAEDLGSANLQPLFLHVAFSLLSKSTKKPIRSLFHQFSEEFGSRFAEAVQDGTRTIQTEGNQIGLEWKSPPWFERKTSVDELAEGLHREFQNSRLVILGISEDAKSMDLIKSGVNSEKLENVETELEERYNVSDAHVWSIALRDGHAIVALNVDPVGNAFKGDLTILE